MIPAIQRQLDIRKAHETRAYGRPGRTLQKLEATFSSVSKETELTPQQRALASLVRLANLTSDPRTDRIRFAGAVRVIETLTDEQQFAIPAQLAATAWQRFAVR